VFENNWVPKRRETYALKYELVFQVQHKIWRVKTGDFLGNWRKSQTHSSSNASGNDNIDSVSGQGEDDDVTVAFSNCAKDKTNDNWKEEEDNFPLSIFVPSEEPSPVLITDPIPDVVSKLTATVSCTEGDKYHIADDGKELEWEGQDMCALLNRLRATIESCKSSQLDLTEKEEKWYSSVWNYDGSEPEEGSMSSDGVPILERLPEMLWISQDKTISGEYILGKPPKKPGGLFIFDESWKTHLSAVMALTLVEFAAGSNSEGDWQSKTEPTSNKWRKILLWAVTVLVAFLYLLYRLGLQCEHEEQFKHAVDVLIRRLKIDPRHKSSLSSVLWQRYNNDIRLWVENEDRRRIARYFEGVEVKTVICPQLDHANQMTS